MSFFKIKDITGDIYYISKTEIVSVEVKEEGLLFSLSNGDIINHIHKPNMQEKSILDEEGIDTVVHLTPTELLEKAFLSNKEFYSLI